MADVIHTSSANTGSTEATLIAKIVQDALNDAAMLRPTVTDYSALASEGLKQIEIPKWSSGLSGPAAQNADGATTTDFQAATFATDTISLDQHVNLPYALPDRVKTQNVLNLEAQLAKEAGEQMAIWFDDKIITELKLVSTSSPDHYVALGNGSTVQLSDIANARMLLNKQNVPQTERYLLISPEQEKAMLALDNFIRADQYGAREGLLNGEIGRVFGFTVMVHNRLNSDDVLAYHKSHVGFAIQQGVRFEKQRGSVQILRDEYSFSALAGFEVMDGGKRGVWMDDGV